MVIVELITERIQFAPHVGTYARAAVPVEAFDRGWKLDAGSAVLLNTGEAFELIVEGVCTPLEYARVLASIAESGVSLHAVTLPFELGQQLNNPDARDWYWMVREHPFPVAKVPSHTSIVTSNEADSEISRFLQLSAPDSAVMPGNPEIKFWVVSRDHNGDLQATAVGTQWSSGARVINSVAVAPAARRQGLGKLVTALAGQQHFAEGAQSVALGVRGSNINALALYRGLGFDKELHFSSVRMSPRSLSD